ncbi:MAG: hypothetical protein WCE23_12825 [Candidatus Binatus sp.]|uniref:hypothetical protein n=1 Tax=Candidatus Binatus sp. TaxID=2811406 RepID=UPI003C764B06
MNLRQAVSMVAIVGVLLATSPAMAFSAAQLKTARQAFCQADREQLMQSAADVLNGQPEAGNPDVVMLRATFRAEDRLQAKLNIS